MPFTYHFRAILIGRQVGSHDIEEILQGGKVAKQMLNIHDRSQLQKAINADHVCIAQVFIAIA